MRPMPTEFHIVDTVQEALNWIEEVKLFDNVTSDRIEATADGKNKAIAVTT